MLLLRGLMGALAVLIVAVFGLVLSRCFCLSFRPGSSAPKG